MCTVHKSKKARIRPKILSETGRRSSVWRDICRKAIPQDLGSLSTLSDLKISDAFLSGTLPAELGSLSGLAALDLLSNQLYGPIPLEPASVSKPCVLRLDNN